MILKKSFLILLDPYVIKLLIISYPNKIRLKKINIIGSGISGLSAACYLQQNGFKTEIFEKHSIPGGLCTSWEKNGYTVNGCLHYIMGTGPGSSFYKMWTEIIDMDAIPYHHHEIWLEVEINENKNKYGEKVFKLYTNIDQLENYLLDLAPEDKKAIKFFTKPMRIMQKFDLPPIMDKLPFFKAMWRGITMIKYCCRLVTF